MEIKRIATCNRNRKDWLRYTTEYKLFRGAKTRAKEYGYEFTIKLEDIKIPEFCPLLGFRLIRGRNKLQFDSPSLDRIDSKKGYSPDNIWVISFKANTIKSDCSLEEMKILVENFEQKIVEMRIHEDRKS